jgi:hypothetical protein
VCGFRGPSRMSARGTVGILDPGLTDVETRAEARDLTVDRFEVPEGSMLVHTRGRTNFVRDVQATLCGGALTGAAAVVQPSSPTGMVWYALSGRLADADFARFLRMARDGPDLDYRGRLWIETQFAGLAGEGAGRSVRGTGALRVREGRVFSLPIFGGLTRLMGRVIPGLDFVLRQTDARASVTIADGRVATEDVEITGGVLSLAGRGHCTFDERLDFDVQLTLRRERALLDRLLRGLVWPIGKLFQFRLHGTAREPRWYPVNFSPDLLRRLGLLDARPGPDAANGPAPAAPPAPGAAERP